MATGPVQSAGGPDGSRPLVAQERAHGSGWGEVR